MTYAEFFLGLGVFGLLALVLVLIRALRAAAIEVEKLSARVRHLEEEEAARHKEDPNAWRT